MNTGTIAIPACKDFAFAVIDDTDDAFVDQIKFIYDLLFDNGIISTKTVWVIRRMIKEDIKVIHYKMRSITFYPRIDKSKI